MAATRAVESRPPYRAYLRGAAEFRKYRSAEQARAALERNGWAGVRAELFEAPVAFENEDEASLYLRTVILQRHVAALPGELGEPFLRDVIRETTARYGEPFVADYVRLDIWATRA
jgi:hypothetical protein